MRKFTHTLAKALVLLLVLGVALLLPNLFLDNGERVIPMETTTTLTEVETVQTTSARPPSTTTTTEAPTTSETRIEETTTTSTARTVPPTTTTTRATTTTRPTTTTTTTRATLATTTTTQVIVSPDGRSGAQLDTPYTVNGVIVVNKNHWVSRNYRPLPDSYQNAGLVEPAWSNFKKMQADAKSEGVNLVHISSYRPYDLQVYLFNTKAARLGEREANRTSARPGQSEHQTGLAIDVTSGGPLVQDFANTAAGQWLWANAYKYGFILRYPQGKEPITGYTFEPWHYRYIGIEHAANFGPNSYLTLEEYLGTN